MSAAVEKLLATARAEIGYLEKASNAQLDDKTANAGSGNYTKYARDLDALGDVYNGRKNGYDWCDVFVDWCFITTFGEALGMKLLCQPYKGCGAGAGYSMNYYKSKGQLYTKIPQPGDQIFFGDARSTWHTGIVEKVEGGKLYTIEGNTGPDCTVVQRCVYSLNYRYIKGYGRPDWSLVKEKPAGPEEGDGDMFTYKQFKEYMARYEKERAAQDGSQWSEADREWAVEQGLFRGDGDGNFRWQAPVTREELAAVEHRDAQRTGAV